MELSKDFSSTTYPLIRIKRGRFLDPVFEAYIRSNPKYTAWERPSDEKIDKSIEAYRAAWQDKEEDIVKTMCEAISLNFMQNIVDVYVVSGNDRQFSDPVVIKSSFPPEEFVDTLVHELTHRLMSDNVQCAKQKIRMGIIFEKIFPGEPLLVRNHIITYALNKHIFVDTLKDNCWTERTLGIIAGSAHLEYKKAWDIVENIGHMKVIEMVRKERENIS